MAGLMMVLSVKHYRHHTTGVVNCCKQSAAIGICC